MLDAHKLEELADIAAGDRDFLAHVVGQFETDTRESLTGLRKAFADGDRLQVTRLAHRMKSGAGVMGATGLHGQCLTVEKFDGGEDALAGEIDRLEEEVERAIAAVLDHFGLAATTSQAA